MRDAVVDDSTGYDMGIQPCAVGEKSRELGARPDARRHVLGVGRVEEHEVRHQIRDGPPGEHSRADIREGELEALPAQLLDAPVDELRQLDRGRLRDEPGDLPGGGSDVVRPRERVESGVLQELWSEGDKEQGGACVLDRGKGAEDEARRVLAHRAPREGFVAEDGAVLQVHHGLQRDQRAKVSRVIWQLADSQTGRAHRSRVERYGSPIFPEGRLAVRLRRYPGHCG